MYQYHRDHAVREKELFDFLAANNITPEQIIAIHYNPESVLQYQIIWATETPEYKDYHFEELDEVMEFLHNKNIPSDRIVSIVRTYDRLMPWRLIIKED